ncbi:hypothetical protein MNB_SM-7-990 [hydrothermal vent metagenome]|uniref:Inner membrane protein YgaP-like transmembrane domain-containing protein n=1 Tax=hydrothermal vent metagenome TaxID=652676 RepID=A0A1W1BKC6_9ZZZZ
MGLRDLSAEKVQKIRKFCRVFRIVLGLVLIGVGVTTGVVWFYLGIIPLIAGIANFCPLCIITKKCDI